MRAVRARSKRDGSCPSAGGILIRLRPTSLVRRGLIVVGAVMTLIYARPYWF